MISKQVVVAFVVVQTATGANAAYETTTLYDNWCGDTANEFYMMPRTCTASSCAAATWHGHAYSEVACGVNDPDAHAATVFGNGAVYLYKRVYADVACTQETFVIGYRLYDDHCIKESDTSSFAYSVRTDTTVQEKWYDSADCTGAVSSWSQWSSRDARSNKCINKAELYVRHPVYMSPQGYIMETYFTDATCSTPNRLLFKPSDVFASFDEAMCRRNADGVYYSRSRYLTFDPKVSAASVFGEATKYMVEEGFYDSNCVVDQSVSVYRADGDCINMGGYSGVFSLDKDDGTYLSNLYVGSSCSGDLAGLLRLNARYQNNGACSNYRKFYSHQAATPAPTTPTPEPTSAPTPTRANTQGASSGSVIAVSIAAIVAGVAAIAGANFIMM